MKKFLLLLSLLCTLQSGAQQFQPQPQTQELITHTVKQWAQTNFPQPPHPQPKIYIAMAPLHFRMLGMTREIAPRTYMIDLNPYYSNTRLEHTLIHELVHVKQMYQGRLKVKANTIEWLQADWAFNTPYSHRPWELEAKKVTQEYCD